MVDCAEWVQVALAGEAVDGGVLYGVDFVAVGFFHWGVEDAEWDGNFGGLVFCVWPVVPGEAHAVAGFSVVDV